jgi:hypothetical protein
MRALFFSLFMVATNPVLFDFKSNDSLSKWIVVNDGVMGGLSKGKLIRTPEGYGKFTGNVSLANNGGFTSIRCNLPKTEASGTSKITFRIKGDGKDYQFRVRHHPMGYQSYIYDFSTTGEWQTIEFSMNEMYPERHGRRLNIPNFDKSAICEFTFLIANKRNEDFELLIDQVNLTN